MRLADDVGDEEDEESQREEDRRDAIGAEAGLGAVALARAPARVVAAQVDRARASPSAATISHTVPGTLRTTRSAMMLSASVKKKRTKPRAKADSVLALSNSWSPTSSVLI